MHLFFFCLSRVLSPVPFRPLPAASSLEGHCVHDILGFVEELIVSEDPEYLWVDSFRSSRTSNEARQKLLYQLTSKIRRNVGRKCIDLGGNAVLGYRQTFDLEGETGLIARAYGTACRIHKVSAVLCCAVLCCAVLCCALLCAAV